MKKAALLIILLAAALIVGGWWWLNGPAIDDPSTLTLYGNVDIRQVSLAFDSNGRIVELRAEEGDRVAAGQVIGVLDTRALELQARQAEARVDGQRQNVLRLHNGSRPEEIAQVRAQLAAAEATATRAEQDFSRATRLQASASGAISQQDVDQARAEAEAARAGVEQVHAALDLAEAGPRNEEIAAAEAELAAAQANLALLRHQIDQGTLRSPVDAVVRSRLLEPGDMATPQRAVFALAIAEPKWIRVYVSEPDLGRVRPGMAAQVVTDTYPGQPVDGKVGYISSVAEFTPRSVQTEELRTSLVYEVRILVEDDADTLRLGQPVTVHLPIGTTP